MNKQDPTTVEIYGQTYNVRGEGDPAYLIELAQFVDARMRDVASTGALADPMKIAILAALNIADEYSRHRKRHEATVGAWMEKTEDLVDRLGSIVAEP
ncbi:MAG TPA: cell division protein ZapA [Thermoanaerobaculia bacterium]|nr:cell division protein ZapA [Thermoanaerobaculia bacterium]